MRARLTSEGVERTAMTPSEFTDFIKRDIARWAPLARRLMPSQSAR